jgi:hypothetical protein
MVCELADKRSDRPAHRFEGLIQSRFSSAMNHSIKLAQFEREKVCHSHFLCFSAPGMRKILPARTVAD